MSEPVSMRMSGAVAQWLVPVASIACAALVGMLICSAMGYDGPTITREIFITPIVNSYKWPDLVVRAAPMILIAAGLAVCFRAGVWNIGAEGQYLMGGIGATAIAIATDGLTGSWILPTMMLIGALTGAAWASIAGWLRARFEVSEVLATLMLTYISVQILNFLVSGIWRNPASLGLPATAYFGPSQTLPPIFSGSIVHYEAPIAVVVVILVWVAMRYSVFGYFSRVVGLAPRSSGYSGIPSTAVLFAVLALSGAISGLAGAAEAAGSFGRLSLSFPTNQGFSAIVVVFLARLNPLALIPAGLVIALVRVGGELAQMRAGIPSAAASIFEILTLLFLLSGDALASHLGVILKWRKSSLSEVRS